jgi:2-alkyl-3-oxoalkanoate reductase
MKVFVAGGSGAIGRRLVPRLVARGDDVVVMVRHERAAAPLRASGVGAVVADALDRPAVLEALARTSPDVVIDQLTALSSVQSYRNFDRAFALTNRLRGEGAEHLVEGAIAAGVRRIVAQSWGNWNYERSGNALKTEDDRFDPDPPARQSESLAAIRRLEAAVPTTSGIEGVALRYGNFYGPGTSVDVHGEIGEHVRGRKLPVIGSGAGVWSFVHIDDAASAAIVALDSGSPGAYNIVDDEPAPVSAWLPAFAAALGAKPPRHVPEWLGRIAAGEVGVSMMTRIRGTSNAKARAELGWRPTYPTFREGFQLGLGPVPIPDATVEGPHDLARAHPTPVRES